MKHTNNLNLTLYEPNDIFNVTGDSNSLNTNMKIIDDNLDHKITKFYASNLGEKSLHDSDNGKIEDLHIYGKSEQQQYSGKNLFDFNAWKDSISSVTNGAAVYGENSIKLTASSNDCFALGTTYYIAVKPKTTYTLSWVANNTKNGTNVVYVYGMAVVVVTADNATAKSITFTTKPDSENMRVQFGVQNAGESITYSNIQLEVGEIATSYEPYVGGIPAPNPDYPQEIKSVGDDGSIEVQTCGKNLFPWNDYSKSPLYFWSTDSSVKGVKNTDVIEFTLNSNQERFGGLTLSSKDFNDIMKNYNGKTIVLSWEMKADNTDITSPMACGWQRRYDSYTPTTSWAKYTNIFKVNTEYINNNITWYGKSNSTTTIFIRNIQIEIGNTATDYEPYKSKTATISTALPLCGIPVSEGGNYTDSKGQQWICDELVYDRIDGVGKIIKRTNEIIFNGSEDWKLSGNNKSAYVEVTDSIKPKYSRSDTTKAYLFSNKYIAGTYVDYYNATKTIISVASNRNFTLYDERFSGNINGLKADMATNNLRVIYALSTPQEIELSAEELQALNNLPTYYPITNVSATSGSLDADMIFNYPISLAEGWNYVKQQLGDTRNYIYSMDLQSAEAYVNSEYAVALMELEV